MDEHYREIDEFPGYRVSRNGEVQSRWKRHGRRGRLTDTWLSLKPIHTLWGHLAVNLHREGQKIRRYIHRLVLDAFVGPRPPGLVCCHYDGDPTNNRIENLRWDTYQANSDDTLRHGRRCFGSTKHAKLREEQVLEIRRLSAERMSLRTLANRFEVSKSNIRAIVTRRSWKQLP